MPWAIEERVAEPLSQLHLVLGPETTTRRFLVAAVRREVMVSWSTMASSAGLTRCRIVPDAFVLPVPQFGMWSVAVDARRILVRDHDGAAFAIEISLFTRGLGERRAPGFAAIWSYGGPRVFSVAAIGHGLR